MFFIIWGKKEKRNVIEEGYFQCPVCNTKQPYKLIQVMQVGHIWYVPLGSGIEVSRYIQCGTCTRQFEAGHYTPNGNPDGVAEATMWDCPKCGVLNPNTTYQCKRCRYSLV